MVPAECLLRAMWRRKQIDELHSMSIERVVQHNKMMSDRIKRTQCLSDSMYNLMQNGVPAEGVPSCLPPFHASHIHDSLYFVDVAEAKAFDWTEDSWTVRASELEMNKRAISPLTIIASTARDDSEIEAK
jgi:hypothetical protein